MQQSRKTVQLETFKNISQPTEFFDTILVFIKIFLIFLTVLVGILYLVRYIHSTNQKKSSSSSTSASSDNDDDKTKKQCTTRLCKSIDNINDILYHMIIIIYFIIAIVVLFAFRDKAIDAVKHGRKKVGEIMGDLARLTGIRKPTNAHQMTTNDVNVHGTMAQNNAPNEQQSTVKTLSTTMRDLKSAEMKDYAMSLVWWNMLFLLPVYAGLFTSRNTANWLIRTAA